MKINNQKIDLFFMILYKNTLSIIFNMESIHRYKMKNVHNQLLYKITLSELRSIPKCVICIQCIHKCHLDRCKQEDYPNPYFCSINCFYKGYKIYDDSYFQSLSFIKAIQRYRNKKNI
jgi:hypothetical protein